MREHINNAAPPLQPVLQSLWIGPSALNRVVASIPGALPQAVIDRAFGPTETVRITVLIRTKSAEGANHISLGQRPGKRSDCKRDKG